LFLSVAVPKRDELTSDHHVVRPILTDGKPFVLPHKDIAFAEIALIFIDVLPVVKIQIFRGKNYVPD
jgi:hypothetical protein